MVLVFLELTKYLFFFLMAFYVALSYYAAIRPDNKRKTAYFLQNVLMFLFHFTGYMVLFIRNDYNIEYFVLYIGQFVYLFGVILFFKFAYPRGSMLLINNMCMLLSIGFVVITRLDFDKGYKQFVITAVATIGILFIPWLIKKVKSFRNFGELYCIAGIALLVGVLFSSKVYGANLSISIGSFSFQPSEFVKILYVFFIASFYNMDLVSRNKENLFISKNKKKKSTVSFKTTIVVTILAAVHVIVLVLSNDLGAALIFFVVYLLMTYIANHSVLFSCTVLAGGSFAAVVAYFLFGHVRQRVEIWLNPWATIDNTGYQICQSLFSIGMGSWFGYGFTQGLPGKIPVAEKDFMFSAIVEEFGVLFGICLILLCLNCLILMMNIASMCNTLFYRLVAVGLGVTYGIQVFLTIGGAIKMIPMTGVTIPFVSYGGSSVVSSLIVFALINGLYNMRSEEVNINDKKRKRRLLRKGEES